MCLVVHCACCRRVASWRRLPGRPVRSAFVCRRCASVYDSRTGRWTEWDEFLRLLEMAQLNAEQLYGEEPVRCL